MSLLDTWTAGEHRHGEQTFPTYRKGTGPGVVVVHEIPGPTPEVIAFAEEVVANGFTVVMPHLFGVPEKPVGAAYALDSLRKVCISKEFTSMATGVTTPVAGWLRSLARELHEELGGPGVGPRRSRDVNLSPEDLAVVKQRAAAGCPVLGLRYRGDAAVGRRFETLTEELGGAFVKVEFEGRKHATLTLHRQQEAVDRVLGFFDERLRAG